MPKGKKGVTLIELLIAISLLSAIVIGFSSIDLFSRYHLLSSDRRAKLQNEVSSALDHMTKQISRAIGYAGNWAVRADNDDRGIRIRIDDNPANGRIDSTDRWIAYRHENIPGPANDSEIRFYPDADDRPRPRGESESIARKIVRRTPTFSGLEFSGDFDDAQRWLNANIIEVKVTCRWYPNQAASLDNPEVTMRTRIKMPSVSTN